MDKVINDINETNEQMKQLQDVFATPTGIAAGGTGEGEMGFVGGGQGWEVSLLITSHHDG